MRSIKIYDGYCESCSFFEFCTEIELPHCNGEDYVKNSYAKEAE